MSLAYIKIHISSSYDELLHSVRWPSTEYDILTPYLLMIGRSCLTTVSRYTLKRSGANTPEKSLA